MNIERIAKHMVTVVPNITGERAELWLCGTYMIASSADVNDVMSAARHLREDIGHYLRRATADDGGTNATER